MIYSKENEEIKAFSEKERKLAPKKLILRLKEIGVPFDKNDKKLYTERALKYFDDFYKKRRL